jgi:hypothetical protein
MQANKQCYNGCFSQEIMENRTGTLGGHELISVALGAKPLPGTGLLRPDPCKTRFIGGCHWIKPCTHQAAEGTPHKPQVSHPQSGCAFRQHTGFKVPDKARETLSGLL